MLTTVAFIFVGWAFGALALFWNLSGKRLLQSDDHVRVVAVFWPIAVPVLAIILVVRAARFGAQEVVVRTATSVGRVVDTYRHGTLLPRRASAGNDLRPRDEYDERATAEVNDLLQEEP